METKQTFLHEGAVVVGESQLPLTDQEWSRLRNRFDTYEYEQPKMGDTYESMSFKVFRVKKQTSEDIKDRELFDIVNSPKFRNALEENIGIPGDFILDRCQCHVYGPGDFIARHVDSESYDAYKYSIGFFLTDDYKGGEFVTFKDEVERIYKPKSRSIIIIDSDVAHEVRTITEGCRMTIFCFFMPPPG